MARRERRDQPRLPIDLEVHLDSPLVGTGEQLQMSLRTRNINARGAYVELPKPEVPPEIWSDAEFWRDRTVLITTRELPGFGGEAHSCQCKVRWVERRGPKKRAVGLGVLFHNPSEVWMAALDTFLESLLT